MGSVVKTSDAPASGLMPNEKAAGKMMMPARTATSVSASTTLTELLTMLSLAPMYEP